MRCRMLDGLVAVVAAATASIATAQTPISLPYGASGLAANPVTGQIWAVSEANDTVMRIDEASHAVASVAVADAPHRLRIDPIRNRVYVIHALGAITMIDGQTLAATPLSGSVGSFVPVGHRLALDPSRNRIYATAPGAVRVVDGGDLSIDQVPLVTGNPQSLVVDPIADRVYTGVWRCCDEDGDVEQLVIQIRPDPPALVDSIVLASPSDIPFHAGLGVDPSTGFTYSNLTNNAGFDLYVRASWTDHALLLSFGGGSDFVIEPTGDRFWLKGTFGGAIRMSTLAAVPGTFAPVRSPLRSRRIPRRRRAPSPSASARRPASRRSPCRSSTSTTRSTRSTARGPLPRRPAPRAARCSRASRRDPT